MCTDRHQLPGAILHAQLLSAVQPSTVLILCEKPLSTYLRVDGSEDDGSPITR